MSAKGIERLFSDIHLDVLKELGSMGTAHAATALSKLVNKKITMPVPSVSWIDFANVADFVGGPENVIVGILVALQGNIQGMMIYLMSVESAHDMASAVLGAPVSSGMEFDQMERSVIEEVGNILVSSYLSSLSNLTNSQIRPSIPFMAVDMANAILSVPAIEFGKMADSVLFIESRIELDGKESQGCFILVPNLHSFRRILRSMGVE